MGSEKHMIRRSQTYGNPRKEHSREKGSLADSRKTKKRY
jgi:hypothetical protein